MSLTSHITQTDYTVALSQPTAVRVHSLSALWLPRNLLAGCVRWFGPVVELLLLLFDLEEGVDARVSVILRDASETDGPAVQGAVSTFAKEAAVPVVVSCSDPVGNGIFSFSPSLYRGRPVIDVEPSVDRSFKS